MISFSACHVSILKPINRPLTNSKLRSIPRTPKNRKSPHKSEKAAFPILPWAAAGDTVAGMSNRRWFKLNGLFGVILCTLFLAPVPALRAMAPSGQVRVALDGGLVPQINYWATLRLILPPLSGGDITVEIQDLRGGPTVRRHLAVYRRHILMPLPYVAGSGGLGGAWPVVVKLFRSGKLLRAMRAQVDMPLAHAEDAIPVAVPRAMRSQIAALALALGKPITPVSFSRRQLAASPVINVASCRWLLLNGTTAQQLSHRRIMALLSLGMRLVYIGGGRSKLLPAAAWSPTGKSANGLAIWKTLRLNGFSHGPPVVVPHLSRMRLPPLHAPGSWEMVAWAIGPVTMLMVILLRWAVPRGWYFIFSIAIGVALLSAASIFYLTATTHPAQSALQWQTDFPTAPVRISTTIRINRALHGSSWIAPHTRGITLPLAWSARAWFAFNGVIRLQRNTSALAYSMTRHVTILACQTRATVNSTFPRGGLMPSTGSSAAPTSGFPVGYSALYAQGQIFLSAHPHHGRDFYNWLDRQPPKVQSTLRLWLLLQFNPHRRYALFTTANRLRVTPLPDSPH